MCRDVRDVVCQIGYMLLGRPFPKDGNDERTVLRAMRRPVPSFATFVSTPLHSIGVSSLRSPRVGLPVLPPSKSFDVAPRSTAARGVAAGTHTSERTRRGAHRDAALIGPCSAGSIALVTALDHLCAPVSRQFCGPTGCSASPILPSGAGRICHGTRRKGPL